jgi:hypothetical protein
LTEVYLPAAKRAAEDAEGYLSKSVKAEKLAAAKQAEMIAIDTVQ